MQTVARFSVVNVIKLTSNSRTMARSKICRTCEPCQQLSERILFTECISQLIHLGWWYWT